MWTGTKAGRKEEPALILTVLHPESPTHTHKFAAKSERAHEKEGKRETETEVQKKKMEKESRK